MCYTVHTTHETIRYHCHFVDCAFLNSNIC